MISIDDILHDNLDSWISEIKSDPAMLDDIFEGKSQEKIEQVKQWITNSTIRTVYHHPRDASEIPCYAIVLENTTEAEQVIGSSGDEYDEILLSSMEDGWIGSDSDILRGRVMDAASGVDPADIAARTAEATQYGLPEYASVDAPVTIKQMYTSVELKDGRRSCHIKADRECGVGKGIFIDLENSVLEGGYVSLVGKNYIFLYVKSSRIGSFLQFGFGESAHGEHTYIVPITVTNAWERVRVDIRALADRDKDRIRFMSFTITNDSVETDLYIDRLSAQQSVLNVLEETFLDNSYRIECWSNNAELTLIMYQIALWNLLKYRTYLESSWGLFRQKIDGGDIMPQPELYPEFLYVRGLTYHCSTIETVPRESDLVALEVHVGRTDYGQ